jgi:hypothetical protein
MMLYLAVRLTLFGVTRTAPRSASKVHTDEVRISDRPTTEVRIGSRVYTARAPKFQVWWDVLSQIEGGEAAYEAARRLSEEADSLEPAEQRALVEQAKIASAFDNAAQAVIYGVEDDYGRVRGGFLRRSLRPEDWAAVMAECADDDSDLDLPELFEVAFGLREAFDPWFQERSASMGMGVPNAPVRPARKAATKPKSARKV